MTTYQWPSAAELQEVEQSLLPVLTQDDPIFSLMPIVTVDADRLLWDQEGNYRGLTGLRGLDGQPTAVRAVGANRYEARPGVYGDFATIDEEELTTRGRLGAWNVPIDISDLVRGRQDQLLHRRINRIRYLGWKLITTGSYSVLNRNGVSHGDSYTLQTYNATTWATAASSTPLVDFRAVQLLGRGYSVNFGAGATAYMNRTTANNMFANTNASDLGGRLQNIFTGGTAAAPSMAVVNQIQAGEDLPSVVVWDDGYEDDSGNFQLFIPNGTVIIVGRRMGGAPIMDFAMTRNANNPNSAPGPYSFVKDRRGETVPPTIEVHDGFNGGLRIYQPAAIVVMDVSEEPQAVAGGASAAQPIREAPMPAKKPSAPTDEQLLDQQYVVLSGGISTPAGARYKGEVVTGSDLGDAGRVRALMERGAIEVADGAD